MNDTRLFSRAGLVFAALAGCLLLARPAAATDAVVGDGTPASCTEAEFDRKLALVQASLDGVLSFNCGGPKTIIFTSQKIIDSQFIVIDGGDEITLSGGNENRLFYVKPGTLILEGIKLTNGFSGNGHGGAIFAEFGSGVILERSHIANSRTNDGYGGGAILSLATGTNFPAVELISSVIYENASSYGAINTVGRLLVKDSVINDNMGGGFSIGGTSEFINSNISFNYHPTSVGGGIRATRSAVTSMTGGIIYHNSAKDGGGIWNEGDLTLTDVTIQRNRTGEGAFAGGEAIANFGSAGLSGVALRHNYGANQDQAVFNPGTMEVHNSTFSGNIYGAVDNDGELRFINATLVNNARQGFPSIHNDIFGSLYLENTIVLTPGSVDDCAGAPADVSDFSMYDDESCQWLQGEGNIRPGEWWGVEDLANNGGPTATHMLTPWSPAVDGGRCDMAHDQRGIARPQGAACDIGAVERRLDEGYARHFLPLLAK